MIVFLNDDFRPAEEAAVSVFDRGFLYGDGLFETILIWDGRPFLLDRHWDRLRRGAEWLELELPCHCAKLAEVMDALAQRNGLSRAVARVTISRGVGSRGYSPQGVGRPTLVVSLHPLAGEVGGTMPRWRLMRAGVTVPMGQAMTRFKTANRLASILARAEAERGGFDEALVCNAAGRVAEASGANVFCVREGRVQTPPLSEGALEGVTRGLILQLCREAGVESEERSLTPEELRQAQGVFLTLSTWGIVEAIELEGCPLPSAPLVEELYERLWERVRGR